MVPGFDVFSNRQLGTEAVSDPRNVPLHLPAPNESAFILFVGVVRELQRN
jgi:hypothetical protein